MSIFIKIRAKRLHTGSSLYRIFEVFKCEDGRWLVFNPDCTEERIGLDIQDGHDAEVMACIGLSWWLKNHLGPDWQVRSEVINERKFVDLFERMCG
jgi:hypothetical protein